MIDDDPDLRMTVEIQLHLKGYRVETADTAASGIRTAVAVKPDIVLLDIGLPDQGGLEVIKELRSRFTTACAGIIMLTALSEQSVMRQAVAAGADDYILKPYDPEELYNRIEMVRERTARNLERNPLTGLPGNNLIHKELQHRIDQGTPFALGYVDIDNFKAFNDRYGPEMGDKSISILSATLSDVVHSSGNENDFIGHIGGDDFVFLTTPDKIEVLCDAMFKMFEQRTSPLYAPEDLARGGIEAEGRDGVTRFFPRSSLSVGAASSVHSRIEKPQRAFELATQAKHGAKSRVGDYLEIWGVSDENEGADKPRRILIVEPGRESSYRLAFEMAHNGFECRTVDNGTDVQSIMTSFKPELIFFNPLLPNMSDGFRLLEKLRGDNSVSCPVAYLVSSDLDAQSLQASGVDEEMLLALPRDLDKAANLANRYLPMES